METLPALRHEAWAWTPPEAQAYIRALEARVETLTSMVHALQAQVGTLQDQLHQTSRNSSRPPSSDPPQHQRPHRPRGQRRRGGQPGHPGSTRTLLPVEAVDEVVVIKPTQCTHCQAPLAGDDPKPWRHRVIEIPPIEPVVTEYQWHQLACPSCGATTPRALACWHPQRDVRSPRASDGRAVHRGLSLVEAHDAAGNGGGVGDPVAYGQKTALRPLAVYRRQGLHSSTGLRPSLCPQMRVLAGTPLFPGEPQVDPW